MTPAPLPQTTYNRTMEDWSEIARVSPQPRHGLARDRCPPHPPSLPIHSTPHTQHVTTDPQRRDERLVFGRNQGGGEDSDRRGSKGIARAREQRRGQETPRQPITVALTAAAFGCRVVDYREKCLVQHYVSCLLGPTGCSDAQRI